MAEPLLGHRVFVAECDPMARLATVRARPAGPAGSAGLDLGPGVELDVDLADPASVAGLTVELPSTGDPGDLPAALRRRLAALLGPERAAAFVALVAAAAGDAATRQRRLASGDDRGEAVPPPLAATPPGRSRPSGEPARRASDRAATGVAPPLQRAALAHVAACAPGVPRLKRAVALLEAAAALDEIPAQLDLRAAARRDAQVGAELVVDLLADGLVVVPGRRAAGALVPIVRRAARLLDDGLLASRLAALAGDLERGGHLAGPHGAPPPAAPALGDLPAGDAAPGGRAVRAGAPPPGCAGGHVRVVVQSLPGAVAEAAVAAHCTGPDHVEVRVAGWAERRHGLWVRAFDPDGDTLLAMGPLRRDGRDAVAHLLVPSRAVGRVETDLTDRPEMPRPSAALAAAGRAIHLGGAAARAERLGDRRTAARRWRQCARAWLGAGDRSRAGQALSCASDVNGGGGRPSDRVIRPLVSDLIADHA